MLDKGVIYVLDRRDELVGTIPWTLPGVGAVEPFGMALSPAGQVFLADPLRHRIVELQLEPPLWPTSPPTRLSPSP